MQKVSDVYSSCSARHHKLQEQQRAEAEAEAKAKAEAEAEAAAAAEAEAAAAEAEAAAAVADMEAKQPDERQSVQSSMSNMSTSSVVSASDMQVVSPSVKPSMVSHSIYTCVYHVD